MTKHEYQVKEDKVIGALINHGTGGGGYYGDVYFGSFEKGHQYQIMPSSENDAAINTAYIDFWAWHCIYNEQWYKTPIEAACKYLRAFKHWVLTVCPSDKAATLPQYDGWLNAHYEALELLNALQFRYLYGAASLGTRDVIKGWESMCKYLDRPAYRVSKRVRRKWGDIYQMALGGEVVFSSKEIKDVEKFARTTWSGLVEAETQKETNKMVKFFKDGKALAIQTDATDEREFTQDFAIAFEDYITGEKFEGQHEIIRWLNGYAEVCCKMRGYKADVKEQRLITFGDVNPQMEAMVTSVANGTQILKEAVA